MINFKKVSSEDIPIILTWLTYEAIREFWDNTEAHRNDIVNFAEGRKAPSSYANGKFSYWIGSYNNEPYALLMTIQETIADHIHDEKLKYISQTGNTYGLDYMIGNQSFLGKGYGAKTLIEFLTYFKKNIDPQADTFLIDPISENTRAKHVFMKAGFEHVENFVMNSEYSGRGKIHHLLIKKII